MVLLLQLPAAGLRCKEELPQATVPLQADNCGVTSRRRRTDRDADEDDFNDID